MENFHITLLSGSSLNYYPNNSLSRFTVKLPHTVEFQNVTDWEVGITNFSCTTIESDIEEILKIRFNENKRINLGVSIIHIIRRTCPNFYEEIKKKGFFDQYSSKGKTKLKVALTYGDVVQLHGDNVFPKFSVGLAYSSRDLFDHFFQQLKKKNEMIKSLF